jgi:hypothetical protein
MAGAIVLPIITKLDSKGFTNAKKGLAGLKGAIAGLGIAAGAIKLGQLGFEFAKMANQDKVSQDLMNASLKKTTRTTEAGMKANEAFIQTLSNQVGILDDNLRPALAGLARVTGSTNKAQKLLKVSLDASAMSGKPLEATSKAVAKAYAGNTTALKKMFPELAKAEAKFIAVHGAAKTVAQKTDLARFMLAALAKEAAGQALIKATPFDKFNTAMDNMKEKLGSIVLPKLTEVLTKAVQPGGAFDKVSKFIDQMGNPNTKAGRAFQEIKDGAKAAGDAIGGFLKFFKADTMSGFINFVEKIVVLATAYKTLKGLAGILKLFGVGKAVAGGAGVGAAAGAGAASGAAGAVAGASAAKGLGLAAKLGTLGVGLAGGLVGMGGTSSYASKAEFDAAMTAANRQNTIMWNNVQAGSKNLQNKQITVINNVTVSAGLGANGQDIGKIMVQELTKYTKKNGRTWFQGVL